MNGEGKDFDKSRSRSKERPPRRDKDRGDDRHKKKHHKRRLIQSAFVQLLTQRLKPGGLLHLATDWVPYAEWMSEVLAAQPALRNLAAPELYSERPEWRPQTHFETRGQRLGHEVRDLLYRKVDSA